MPAAEVLALRQALQERFPNAQPVVYRTAGAVPTGLAGLDAMLPGNGLPRGRLVLWSPGGGATAILRAAALGVVERGERSAWVDAQQMVHGDGWSRGPLLVRPTSEVDALMCAEELLRCGGFALVVLTGVTRSLEREAVRISRAVKDGGGALIALSEHLPVAHMRIRSSIDPASYKWKLNPFGEPAHIESVRIHVEANAMGWSGRADLTLPVSFHAQRSAADPILRDRRNSRRTRRNTSLRRDVVARESP